MLQCSPAIFTAMNLAAKVVLDDCNEHICGLAERERGRRSDTQAHVDLAIMLAANDHVEPGFWSVRRYQATFAWRALRTDEVNLSVEVPFIASPAFTVTTPGPSLPLEYASLYLTPGVRVTFVPSGPISFFGAIGGGYARYSESTLKADRSANPGQRDTNTGALQLGGGVDVRGFGWLGFRGEVRDVYTGARRFSIPTPGEHVHNVIGSAGLVVRF
jgi:hypothetical protein